MRNLKYHQQKERRVDAPVRKPTVSKCIVSAFPSEKCVLPSADATVATITINTKAFSPKLNSNLKGDH